MKSYLYFTTGLRKQTEKAINQTLAKKIRALSELTVVGGSSVGTIIPAVIERREGPGIAGRFIGGVSVLQLEDVLKYSCQPEINKKAKFGHSVATA